jgi:deferrochelatase/peroxidase EfeB
MSEFQYNDLEGRSELQDAALRNLQCNILASTGRVACEQIFHRFKSKRAFLKWLKETPSPSPARARDPYLRNVLFTHEGLSTLGLPDELLNRMEPAFRRGTRNSRTYEKLSDVMAQKWDPAHFETWHAVELSWRTSREKPVEAQGASDEHVVHVERGHARGRDGKPLENDEGPRYNHFGIQDTKTNPVYTERDLVDSLRLRPPGADGTWKWDPRAKLSTLLVRDPLANHDDCFGSYFVFRKFSQDVGAFRKKLTDVARELLDSRSGGRWWWKQHPALDALSDQDLQQLIEALGARPVHDAMSTEAGVALAQLIFGVGPNGERPTGERYDFDYSRDPGGKLCPFSAHARAVNARGTRHALEHERRTVIARRGISHDTGVLFWCAQASIGEQFEYIQEKWVNGSNVNLDHEPTPGVDYLIGKAAAAQIGFSLDVRGTIALQASEYLFAPSLLGFQRLQALGEST